MAEARHLSDTTRVVRFLMCISFLPFPTALLAEYLAEPGGRTLAVAAYSATRW